MNCCMLGIALMLLLTVIVMPQTEASKGYFNFRNAQYPGKCYIHPQLILNEGQTAKFPIFQCSSVTCIKNGIGEIHSCGYYNIAPPGCMQIGPRLYREDYPKCCEPAIICPRAADNQAKIHPEIS